MNPAKKSTPDAEHNSFPVPTDYVLNPIGWELGVRCSPFYAAIPGTSASPMTIQLQHFAFVSAKVEAALACILVCLSGALFFLLVLHLHLPGKCHSRSRSGWTSVLFRAQGGQRRKIIKSQEARETCANC